MESLVFLFKSCFCWLVDDVDVNHVDTVVGCNWLMVDDDGAGGCCMLPVPMPALPQELVQLIVDVFPDMAFDPDKRPRLGQWRWYTLW